MYGDDRIGRLRREVDAIDWYHTLELAPGIETPGWFDLRKIRHRLPIPPSLEGKRCLDVGTFDGFWAFEMESRGAAEVLAIDILDPLEWDWPRGSRPESVEAISARKARGVGFELARRELGSAVERRELSVYDLDRSAVGHFDLVFLGSLLLHLRDPVGALEKVCEVCSGTLVVCDAIDPLTSALFRRPLASLDGLGRPWWWRPNVAGLVRMAEAAGFRVESRPRRLRMPPGAGHARPRPTPRTVLTDSARRQLLDAWWGDPHAIVTAHPRAS